MLKIKKSRRYTEGHEEWILYNPDNFRLHTHCKSLRVALTIKRNVEKQVLPKSTNIHTLESHLRVTRNKKYRAVLEECIAFLRSSG